MRTPLVIDDAIFRELKRRAAEQRRTLSEVAQETLRRGWADAPAPRRRPRIRLRSCAMGRARVDRTRLHDVLDRQ